MSWKTDLIKALATVKANTENHNGELKEFKETFKEHKLVDAKDTLYMKKKIETLQCTLANLECPHDKRMGDLEKQLDKKILDDAEADKATAKSIGSLEAGRKYQYLSIGGVYTLMGIVLKKIYS